jgi:hypothetical protein
MRLVASWSGSRVKVERREENAEAWCVWAAMREMRERSAGVVEDAWAGGGFEAGSGGRTPLVRAEGRKNGAFFGCCGGSSANAIEERGIG